MKKTSYQQYLQSPKWKELRAAARARAGNKCELCGGAPDHVHHVRYPKRYQDDHIDNLLVACASCHSKLHGVRDDIYLETWQTTPLGIGYANDDIYISIRFDPIPAESWRPIILSSWMARHPGSNVESMLGGMPLMLGTSATLNVPWSDPFFTEARMTSIEQLLLTTAERAMHEGNTGQDAGNTLLDNLVDNLPLLACRIPAGMVVDVVHIGSGMEDY